MVPDPLGKGFCLAETGRGISAAGARCVHLAEQQVGTKDHAGKALVCQRASLDGPDGQLLTSSASHSVHGASILGCGRAELA